MDRSLLSEIHYLTRLIEQHKRKLPEKQNIEKNFPNQDINIMKSEKCTNLIHRSEQSMKVPKESSNSTYAKRQVTGTNVYVNPNFKPQNPVIHINPKVRIKPLIHVNPKMMKDVTSTNETVRVKPENVEERNKQSVTQTDIKRSVYVNPKLMKKLTSATENKPVVNKQVATLESIRPICSRLKFVKGTSAMKVVPTKINNSNVVILSKRKLIRVRRTSKGTSASPQIGLSKVKKPLTSPFKKTKITPQKIIKTKLINTVQSMSKDCNFVKSPIVKPKINRYRIDRTESGTTKIKRRIPAMPKKVMNKTMELVTIGGIVYKSSKNQLVRRSYSLKRKRTASAKTDKFIITTNGKKLRRLKPAKESESVNGVPSTNTIISTKSTPNASPKINYKTNISNKVKQRSIQILRNKMRKNNQPCLIFQRFGYCANHENGTCPKLHDKKQVSLCKKFLQGNCLLDNCPLSHNVGPEKMPTCKYFLEGCCTRDACPYRHIKVSSSTPICIEFLQGYCAKGSECKRRHEYLCPEFEKTEKCSKGKYCPYPHKTHSSSTKQCDKYLKVKRDVHKNQVAPVMEDTSSTNHENRLRYYEQADTLTEHLEKKKESILRKIKIMRSVHAGQSAPDALNQTSETSDANSMEQSENESELEIISESRTFKRPPIGSLPAYIPIN